jgi:hypothetical protein
MNDGQCKQSKPALSFVGYTGTISNSPKCSGKTRSNFSVGYPFRCSYHASMNLTVSLRTRQFFSEDASKRVRAERQGAGALVHSPPNTYPITFPLTARCLLLITKLDIASNERLNLHMNVD